MSTPNNQDKLLSDEELRDAINSRIDGQFVASVKSVVSGDTASTDYYLGIVKKNMLDLINTQKRLYAESVIGEDESAGEIPHNDYHWRIRNELRAEQSKRLHEHLT